MSLSETRCSGPRYRRYDRSAPSFTYKETAGIVSGMRVATETGMTASSIAAALVQTDMRLARSQSPVIRGGQFSRIQPGDCGILLTTHFPTSEFISIADPGDSNCRFRSVK